MKNVYVAVISISERGTDVISSMEQTTISCNSVDGVFSTPYIQDIIKGLECPWAETERNTKFDDMVIYDTSDTLIIASSKLSDIFTHLAWLMNMDEDEKVKEFNS